jgi:hypothetical protein
MTFGGAPCPALWGVISDIMADACNSLIHNPHWDHVSIFDPLSDIVDTPSSLPSSMAFASAQELAVNVPINDIGKVDMYIDDNIGVALEFGDNARRVQ